MTPFTPPNQARVAYVALPDDEKRAALVERLRRRLETHVVSNEAAPPDAGPHAVLFARIEDIHQIAGWLRPTEDVSQKPLFVYLCDSGSAADCFHSIAEHDVAHVVDFDYLNDDHGLDFLLANLPGSPREVGFGDAWNGTSTRRRRRITSSTDRREFFDTFNAEINQSLSTDQRRAEYRLALEEVVNNAMYHAFFDGDTPRYSPEDDAPLRAGDEVVVEYVADDAVFAFSVYDNAGVLSPETTRKHILRHMTGQGLLDARGRGLFLTYSLANAFIIHSVPGEMTEVIASFSRGQSANLKMLLVTEAPADRVTNETP